jgi:hypothetical protein
MTKLNKILKDSGLKIPKDSQDKLEERLVALNNIQYQENENPKLDYGYGDLVKFVGSFDEEGNRIDSDDYVIGDLIIINGFDKEEAKFKTVKYDSKSKIAYRQTVYADEIELEEVYSAVVEEEKEELKKESKAKATTKKESKVKTKENPVEEVTAEVEETEAKKPAKKITPKTGKEKALNAEEKKSTKKAKAEDIFEEDIIEDSTQEDDFAESIISYDDLTPKGDIHEKIKFMNNQGSNLALELGKRLYEVQSKKLFLETGTASFQEYCDKKIGLTYNIAIKRVQVYKAVAKLGLTKEQFEKIGYYRFREGLNFITKENLNEALEFIEKSNPSGEDFKIYLKEAVTETDTQKIAKISLALFNDEVSVLEEAINVSLAEEPVEESLDQKRKRSIALVNICQQFLQFKNSSSSLEADLQFLNDRYGLTLSLEKIQKIDELLQDEPEEANEKELTAALG